MATASNWLWNFLLAFFTNFITGAIDFRFGYVFAGCNVLGGLIVYFFVMEGRLRTLEEIDTMYIEHVKPWQSESWQPPSLETLRKESAVGWRRDAESNGESLATSAEHDRDPEKEDEPVQPTAPSA